MIIKNSFFRPHGLMQCFVRGNASSATNIISHKYHNMYFLCSLVVTQNGSLEVDKGLGSRRFKLVLDEAKLNAEFHHYFFPGNQLLLSKTCSHNPQTREVQPQWKHLCQFTIDSTSKFHVESPSIFHRLWKANPRGKDGIELNWIIRPRLNFQNRWNIDVFSTWYFRCHFNVKSM